MTGSSWFRGGAMLLAGLALSACAASGDRLVSADGAAQGDVCSRAEALIETAQYDNFSFNFASADEKLVEVLALYDANDLQQTCRGDRLPPRDFVLATRALALSNQEQFVLADRLLEDVESRLETREQIDEQLLLLSFQTMHARNLEQSGAASDERITALLGSARSLLVTPEAQSQSVVDSAAVNELFALDRRAVRRRIGEAAVYYLESGVAANRGEPLQALTLIDRAIGITSELPEGIGKSYLPRFRIHKAVIELDYAETLAGETQKQAAFAGALQTATLATADIREIFENTPIAARALMIRAKAETEVGDFDSALATYAEAFTIYEENPTSVAYESVWPFFSLSLAELSRTSDPAEQLAIKKVMFRAAQIVRSSVVAQSIASSDRALRDRADSSEAGELAIAYRTAREDFNRQTVKSILASSNFYSLDGGAQAARELEAARLRLRDARAALGDAGGAAAREFDAIINRPVALEDVQRLLAPDEAVVNILTGRPVGLIFVIGRESLDIHRIDIDSKPLKVFSRATLERSDAAAVQGTPFAQRGLDLTELAPTPRNFAGALTGEVRFIADKLTEQGRIAELPRYRIDIARRAYREFIEPAEASLSKYRRLVFAVSGPLAAVPMEMLVAGDLNRDIFGAVAGGDYTGVPWFGMRKSISYIPSPRGFVELRSQGTKGSGASRRALVFSGYQDVPPERHDQQAAVLLAANNLSTRRTQTRTDYSCVDLAQAVAALDAIDPDYASAQAIKTKLGPSTDLRVGPEFTVQSFNAISDSLKDYKILHFNTHGILWDNPDCFVEPALTINVDTAAAAAGPGADRLLSASEIQGLELDALLVVLAACETAGGDGLGGESLSGLARSFLLAGSRSIVATHWQVEGKSTDALMQSFYDALAKGDRSFQDSMTVAQDSVRRNAATSHPYYWAPFVLIGDASTKLE